MAMPHQRLPAGKSSAAAGLAAGAGERTLKAMRKSLFPMLIAGLLVAATPAPAQNAKSKGCFSAAEQAAEQQVRHAIFLRESALRCEAPPFSAGTAALWSDIAQQFGDRFARQTDLRRKAYEREFPRDDIGSWDGRVVMHFRHYPLTEGYCQDVKRLLKDVQTKGWGVFVKQSVKSKGEVLLDYKVCN
jgi:hypothetical protein